MGCTASISGLESLTLELRLLWTPGPRSPSLLLLAPISDVLLTALAISDPRVLLRTVGHILFREGPSEASHRKLEHINRVPCSD